MVIPLIRQQLTFKLHGAPVEVHPDVDEYYPQMRTISRPHSLIAAKFKPQPGRPVPAGLSCALELKGATLSVEGYYGQGEDAMPRELHFGYVASLDRLRYYGRVTLEKVANRLLWSVPLDSRKVEVEALVSVLGGTERRLYTFEAPADRDSIDLRIIHGEPEVPMLFRGDSISSWIPIASRSGFRDVL